MTHRMKRLLRPRLLVPVALIAAFFVFVGTGIGGVGNNGLIELDGNAFVDAASPPGGLDWSCLFGTSVPGIPDPNCSGSAQSPISEQFKTDAAIPFGNQAQDDSVGTGTKDILPIQCDPANGINKCWDGIIAQVQPKDDIEHAGWAAYEDPVSGDLITYFVADKYSTNGNSFFGEWFFKGEVTRDADGTYHGDHQLGDTLVLIDNAGNSTNAPSRVGVYQWDPGCDASPVPPSGTLGLPCADKNLATVLAVGAADCAASSGSADVCASFNTAGGDSDPAVSVPSAWPFQASRSHAPANFYDTSEFVEGAVNLTALLNGSDCFTTTQAETRSSSSTDASSQDVVLGRLTTCGTIKIVKDAQPNDANTSFPFTATNLSPASFSLTDDGSNSGKSPAQTYLDVKPTTDGGGPYTVAEGTLPTGWVSQGPGTCDNGSSPSTGITVGRGETVTCTFTNVKPPALHLRKVVVNDNGGTATVANFTLTADGTGTNDLSGTSPVDSDSTLQPDTWALSESGPAGYTASAWVCVGGTQSGSNITLGTGEEATCTITNDDNPPALHLRKVVVNDNGGTATVANFTLTANGTGTNDISGTSPVDSGSTLQPDTWALSETSPAGYTASAWVCVGGTQSGSNITLATGEEATCTITNDDNAPALHLRKVVVNDNGGTAVATDWTLSASGPTPLSGTTPVDSGATFSAGSYALSESGPAGYTASAWVCTGSGSQSGSNITLGLGQSATCTITNDDNAPALHLRKVVVNNNGGTATTANFTLTANGTGTNDLSGTSPVDSGTGLKADTWALSETSVYGYTASAWVCVGGTQSGSNITLGLGQSATCTITNDDQPGTIIVKKITKPLNTGSFGFTTTGSGYNGFTLVGGGQNSQTLNAGTYTVHEGTQLGWILTGIGGSTDPNTPYNCTVTGTGGSTGVGDLNTETATITLKIGDTVTCVFENTGQGVTRTQGFWATHTPLANIAWFGGTAFGHTFPGVAGTGGIGDKLLCGRSIDTLGKLMGGFWSDVSKTSTGKKRSALDQARMQLLQQLLAAELNASAFGSVPSGGSGQFAVWEAAFCGTDQTAIQNALQGAASFNNSGDSSTFTPGTSADSKNARAIADRAFWDKLPAGV